MAATRYRLVVEYDGAGFTGWQVQTSGMRTVQGALEAAIARVTSESPRVSGSGRTDKGVHALGQVASFVLETQREADWLSAALNGVLPPDVAIRQLEAVELAFDPRRDARAKRYRYELWNARVRSPVRAARMYHVPYALDAAALREASSVLAGPHDFASFQAAGSPIEATERTLLAVTIHGCPGGELAFEFEGTGFLRHMVRILVGTLLEVGEGKRTPESLVQVLAAKDRTAAGPTAPAHALTLLWVRYGSSSGGSPELRGSRDSPARTKG